jgi:mycothiol S-conjugate amidase
VVLTYSDEQGHYPHLDHLRVHEATVLAFERAGDGAWYPESGDPFAPAKLYYSQWSSARIRATHDKMVELGLESPYPEDWLERADADHRITSRVHVGDYWHIRDAALRAHATQVEPESPFWFGLPPEIAAEVYPWDDYILARSSVDTQFIEDDLFAGIR